MQRNEKLFVRTIADTCSKCPDFDYQWDSWGNNGRHICLAVREQKEPEFAIDADANFHNGFRILTADKTMQFNPAYWIPSWCPLPDVENV